MSDSWDPMSSKLKWTPNDFQSGARDLMISIFSPDLVLNTVRSLKLGVESTYYYRERVNIIVSYKSTQKWLSLPNDLVDCGLSG